MFTFEIVYDYDEDCPSLSETFTGTYEEMQAYVKELKEAGYFNIDVTQLYDE